ncbi:HesB family protein, partial [human gut metagenome]
PEPDTAHVAELNQQVNDLYTQIMSSEGMVRYNTAKKRVRSHGQPY